MYAPPAPIIRTSTRVMMALPTTTKGLRARFDRFGGGGSCSGSSAARGLRGEIGGLSLIDKPEVLSVKSWLGKAAATVCDQRVYLGFISEYGETVDFLSIRVSWPRAA